MFFQACCKKINLHIALILNFLSCDIFKGTVCKISVPDNSRLQTFLNLPNIILNVVITVEQTTVLVSQAR